MLTNLLLSAVLAAPASAAPLRVFTATSDLAALTRELGGKEVEVESLSAPVQNPHFVEAKPSLIVKLMKADALVMVGLELESGWAQPLVQGARNANILEGGKGYIDASQAVQPIEIPSDPSRAMGDVHPGGNPHYMTDPSNVAKVAALIAARLSVLRPEGKPAFEGALNAFQAKLDAKAAEWDARMKPHKGSKFVSYHKDWAYFAKRYGLESTGQVEPKPGIPPTPSHTAALIRDMKAQGSKIILTEPWYERRTPDAIASETGAKVLVMSAQPEKGEDLLTRMGKNVELVASALEGK